MADSTLPGVLKTGNHASRPAANTVGSGTLYACSTHALIYQSDASSWSTWATLTGTGLSDPMTTRGDIIIRNASNVSARLGVGSNGQVLQSDGTDISWQTPSSGGVTQAYLGYNTVGGSTTTVTTDRWYLKKVSPANACLITDVEFYGAQSADFGQPFSVGLFTDSSGPAVLLSANALNANVDPRESSGTATPRWFGAAIGYWVTAGDYWIGFAQRSTARWTVYYDGSGSDVTYDAPTDYVLDPTHGTRTTTSNKYSIRANTIR